MRNAIFSHSKLLSRRSPQKNQRRWGLLLCCLVAPLLFGLIPPVWAVPMTSPPILSRSKPMIPQAIADKIFQDLATRTPQPQSQFQIKSAEPQQWPNSCLGLPQPEEFCAQMITPGWRVTVNDGKKSWIYRTDQRGKVIRLQPESPAGH